MALALHGFNTLLLSRTQSKLERLAQHIKSRCSDIQTKVLLDPFNTYTSSDNYNELEGLIEHLNVAILVNNNSQLHTTPVPFIVTNKEDQPSRSRGSLLVARFSGAVVLTMGSFKGLFATPLSATYSGSKAFLQQWSSTCSQTQARRRGWAACALVDHSKGLRG
ncbi:Very-long-chain 3-oxoacyl-CoA reductase [Lachnellula cervina]|uniref:Very-long-chain 3-oxoacyl-CoA reductase n=1 Tax=Lachnellula cervina TaxID=1316786 RepID=A0A7D8Z0L3_9HELO|nr:Very-long-chain 3-oxoacyl-CoA reductase [Lachnellula cervina]